MSISVKELAVETANSSDCFYGLELGESLGEFEVIAKCYAFADDQKETTGKFGDIVACVTIKHLHSEFMFFTGYKLKLEDRQRVIADDSIEIFVPSTL